MKSAWWAISLCAFLVIGSLDSIPDPPAVSQHDAKFKCPSARELAGNSAQPRLDSNLPGASSHLRIRFSVSTSDPNPSRSDNWIVLTLSAADPSPPAF